MPHDAAEAVVLWLGAQPPERRRMLLRRLVWLVMTEYGHHSSDLMRWLNEEAYETWAWADQPESETEPR